MLWSLCPVHGQIVFIFPDLSIMKCVKVSLFVCSSVNGLVTEFLNMTFFLRIASFDKLPYVGKGYQRLTSKLRCRWILQQCHNGIYSSKWFLRVANSYTIIDYNAYNALLNWFSLEKRIYEYNEGSVTRIKDQGSRIL